MSAYRDAAPRAPDEQQRGYTMWDMLCFLLRECPEETIVAVFMGMFIASLLTIAAMAVAVALIAVSR